MAAASGFSPDYLNEYNGYRLEGTAIAFIVLNTLFVALRGLAQHLRPVRYGWDDFFIVIAWLFCVALCCVTLVETQMHAVGYHLIAQTIFRPEKIPVWGKLSLYTVPCIYVCASTFPKLAILALYLRIFIGKWVRIATWTTAAVLVVALIVNIFTVIFQCNPRDKAWNPELPGHCNNIEAHFRWSALPNIVTDVVMLIIPVPITLQLSITRSQKVAIILTFLIGSLGLVTSIFRMVAFFKISTIPLNDGSFLVDSTWDATPELIYIVVESSVYLISACLLSCRSLVNYILKESKTFDNFKTYIRTMYRSRPSESQASGRFSYELHNVGEPNYHRGEIWTTFKGGKSVASPRGLESSSTEALNVKVGREFIQETQWINDIEASSMEIKAYLQRHR